MTVYPFAIDSDQTIIRIDDDITEIGGDSINQLRSAVFAIEKELGIQPSGSAGSVANRLNVSLNPDGSIRASALTSIGLATLPIVDNQVASNAGIKEFKLALDFSTSDLHTLITTNSALLASLTAFANETFSDLNLHIAGANLLSDGSTSARHVLSHIDVNHIPNDSRDPSFNWAGLRDKTGTLRSATQAAQALLQINNDLVNHENAVAGAHVASAVVVDTSNFIEIPTSATDAQKVFNYLDEAEVLNMGLHRATQHANGVPRVARSQSPILPDGYRENVVPPTPVLAYLTHAPNTGPVDDLSIGDDLVKFVPANNTGFVFDALFSQVRIGDQLRIDYSNGVEVSYPVESIRYIPNTEWVVRLNGVNLFESTDGYATARIDRPLVDPNTYGVLAVAPANANSNGSPGSFNNLLQSVIVGSPRGATAFGLGFDPGQLNSTHYNLYLEMYPTGNPVDRVISLPAIDVTGNQGITPGNYTLDLVVQNINNNFRSIGYNYRLIAFAYQGNVGIMLADAINNVSFAIITGSNATGTLLTGIYTNNVIGGNTLDDFDALGFSPTGADLASPAYQSSWTDATAAQSPTKIIVPLQGRNYIVNGQRRDNFAPTYLANADGYWDGYISARTPVGLFTVEVTYTINLDLAPAKLKAGKTIVVQPSIPFSSGLYSDVDYGRFIIKNVVFVQPCGNSAGHTEITVINGIHGTGAGFGFSSLPQLPVRLYFGEDSVGFNFEEIIDQVPTPSEYHRFHEIYINQNGRTFSHERARLPRQTEDTNKLSTDNLHINSVSPKLRGYRGADPLVFNKFVRFYVLSYDSTSGEYDGYLGEIAGVNNILRTGEVVTGRKDVVTRFYDETNIDYIDMTFQEISTSPGVSLLSTDSPRYVDIEIFSSLETDEEFLLLATCEVNWDPAANQFVIQNTQNERQFGSVDATDFTDSALDFISTGDRLLHSNGVIRGLDLDSISSVANSGEIFFHGGVALVNGTIVTANNSSVTIPQISDSTSGRPQTLTWGICVNEDGNLVPILITATKEQFFATFDLSNNYYVQSVSFSELIAIRKDLTLIALANVTIASLTINSVSDARKFIESDNYANVLTITEPNVPGNFHTFEAAAQWLQQLGGDRALVNVSGNFTIDDAPVDLSGFTFPVVFQGDGATITVTISKGILLGSFVTLKNIRFEYNPIGLSFAVGDLVCTGNGCLYADPTGIFNRIFIERCQFECTMAGTQRPPFINIELDTGTGIRQSSFIDNEFFDTTTTSMALIAIINTNNGGGHPAILNDVKIDNNRASGDTQGIYITTISGASAQTLPGMNTFNTSITNNSCGVIGVLNSAQFANSAANAVNSLLVANNRLKFIATLDAVGHHVSDFNEIDYGAGNLIIRENAVAWIHIAVSDVSTQNNILSSTTITGNIIEAQSNAFLNSFYVSGDGNTVDAGIIIFSANPGTEKSVVNINNNWMKYGYHPSLFGYKIAAIWCNTSAIIANNTIRCMATGATGILMDIGTGATPWTHDVIIQGNQLHRIGVTIASFITVNQATASDFGLITNNTFDALTVDGSNQTTITAPNGYTVTQNKNHVVVHTFNPRDGAWTIGNVLAGPVSSSTSFIFQQPSNATGASYTYEASGSETAVWRIPLLSSIPMGVTLLGMQVSATLSPSGSTSVSTVSLTLNSSTNFTSSSPSTVTSVTNNFTVTPSATSIVQPGSGSNMPDAMVSLTLTSSGTPSIIISSLTLTYHW